MQQTGGDDLVGESKPGKDHPHRERMHDVGRLGAFANLPQMSARGELDGVGQEHADCDEVHKIDILDVWADFIFVSRS